MLVSSCSLGGMMIAIINRNAEPPRRLRPSRVPKLSTKDFFESLIINLWRLRP